MCDATNAVHGITFDKFNQNHYVLGIHDLFGTELAMIFSFHVGLTDSVMQRMQFFFSVSSTFSCHRIARFIILIFNNLT
jgi:hypothetical protein